MQVLVLCSGTGSVDSAFESMGWEIVSVDWKKKLRPTICADLMKWDNKSSYTQDHFSFVWASPQCTMFSVARTSGGPRDIEGATALVKRCMEIAEYFGCAWALENPATGLLKRQPLMQGVPWCDVCYCKYGYDYKKPTRIWHSSGFGACFEPSPTCCKASPCPAVAANNSHARTAQDRASKRKSGDSRCSVEELYSMPPELCHSIAAAAAAALLPPRNVLSE